MSMTQTNLCKWRFSDCPICQLGVLNRLLLADYNFVGSLPSEIRLLTRLDLFNDQVTGSIPTELATIVNHEDVLIGGNQLMMGTIPQEIGAWSRIWWPRLLLTTRGSMKHRRGVSAWCWLSLPCQNESSKVVGEEAGTEDNGIFSANYGRFVFARDQKRIHCLLSG
jgi:hypothetical protein